MAKKPLYRRRWVQSLAAAVLLVFLLAEVWLRWFAWEAAPLGRTPESVERVLVAQLPLGSPLDSAIALFKRTNIEHSVSDAPPDYVGPAHLAGGPRLFAIERNVDGDFFVSESIQIVLSYDVERRLVHHSVKSAFTGP
jgi:hypothetical protein